MIDTIRDTSQPGFLSGGGEMGQRFRCFPWQSTALGSAHAWPQTLKASVQLMLNSRFPMFIWWGPERITLYNDAYRAILGDKDPGALGRPGSEVWQEIWPVVGPLADKVTSSGEATWAEDQALHINRQGFVEESYFTFSYSPMYADDGSVAGVFCACTETTDKVMATKKLQRSEENLRNIIMQAPVAMGILRGPEALVEVANERMLEIWGRSREDMMQQPLFQALREASNQGYEQLYTQVFTTGETVRAFAVPVRLPRSGGVETIFVNFTFEALRQGDTITGVMAVCVDVTGQVRDQQKREEAIEEIQAMIASAPYPIGVYVGRELQIKLANQKMIETLGKGPGVIGQRYRELLPELSGQGLFEQIDAVYTTGNAFHARNQRVDLVVDGRLQPFYFNYSFTPLFDKRGEVYGVMNTGADVTDLYTALEQVKAAEAKALLAMEAAALGTYEYNLSTGALTASPRFHEIFGQAEAAHFGAYLDIIHPDDLRLRHAAHEAAAQTGELEYEVRIRPIGRQEWCWVKVIGRYLTNESGNPTHIMGVVQDISAQKTFAEELARQVKERTRELEQAQESLLQSNEYLQQVIDRFEAGLAVLVPVYEAGRIVDFTFRMTNQAYTHYSQLSPEAIRGKRVGDVFPQYQTTDAFERYVETFETGKTNKWDLHYNVDGLDVHLSISASKGQDEVIVNFSDFTRLKGLQAELERHINELERSNRNLEDFAYAASHDLKEPIRKIHFFGDRLKTELGEGLNESQRTAFEKLENAARRMGTLVDDLLAYSKVSSRPVEAVAVDLNEILQLVQLDLELEIADVEARITVQQLPAIYGYPRQLQQLFQNLLGNALKYRQPGLPPEVVIGSTTIKGSELPVAVSAEQRSQSFVCVTVADRGLGFDEADAEIIFDVFKRLHQTSHRGTGVGLSIARKVAENHKGYIWAEGRRNEGATFFVAFPV